MTYWFNKDGPRSGKIIVSVNGVLFSIKPNETGRLLQLAQGIFKEAMLSVDTPNKG